MGEDAVIRALFLTSHLRMGGAQRAWSLLLPELAQRGFEPRLLTLRDKGILFDDLRAAGVPAGCAGMRHELDLGRLRGPLRVRWRPDLVVSHDERSHLVARGLARRHGVPHVASDYGGPGFRLRPHAELVRRLLAPGFAACVADSERRVPDLVARRFAPERVHVIRNGVSGEKLRPTRSRRDVRAEIGVPEDAFLAVLVAVLRPEKRPERFLAAIRLAHAREPRVAGVVVGSGPLEGELRAEATVSGSAVRLLGQRRDVADLVAAADAVCLTSDVEGAPFAALEAMALARPVVAMRAGALDEVVLDGSTGVLVGPGDVPGLADALVALSGDRARAAALGSRGRVRQRECFDLAAMCDTHAELLGGLVNAARASSRARLGAIA